jgi:hypothetical protein
MFKVHQLLPPDNSGEPVAHPRLVWKCEAPLETSFWGRPATRITIETGERIYVRESAAELDNLWLGIDENK